MTVIRYLLCDRTPIASLHESLDEAILAARYDTVAGPCRTVGVEVIPPDETWTDSYVIKANTAEWKRLASQLDGNPSGLPDETGADLPDSTDASFTLYVRTPSWVWAKVATYRERAQAEKGLADLIARVGRYRAKLIDTESRDITSDRK